MTLATSLDITEKTESVFLEVHSERRRENRLKLKQEKFQLGTREKIHDERRQKKQVAQSGCAFVEVDRLEK